MANEILYPLAASLSDALRRLVPGPSVVLLAVSGGPDSVALLSAWRQLLSAGQRSDILHVAHYDHRLRSESAADADFVRRLCADLSISCHVGSCDSSLDINGQSIEEAARNARYAFLSETAATIGAPYVATGHTADDQVETVLASLLRGTGIHGLGGMPEQRALSASATLIRPLLHCRREQVIDYLSALAQSYCQDASNAATAFTRNRIRHTLLPLMRSSFNPRVDDAILRLSGIAQEHSQFLLRLADELLDRAILSATANEIVLSIAPMESVDRVLIAEAVRRLLDRYSWPRGRIGADELRRIADLVTFDCPSAWDLPDGLRAERISELELALKLSRKNHL